MDLSLLLGVVLGFGLIGVSIAISGHLGAYWDFESVLITLGGSMAATMVNFSIKELASVWHVMKVAITSKETNPNEIIATIVRFAEISRREGLLALEERAQELDEPFLQKGIQLVVDGTDPELVRGILEIELNYMEERHSVGQRIFERMGGYCPAFGMIGTLIGLIMMLQQADDAGNLVKGMGVALITTLYGVILANLVFLPIADRLRLKNDKEVLVKEIMIEGILSIRAGENPRIVEEKLNAFLPRYRKISRGEAVEPIAEEVRTGAQA
ncbi:MAG: motility protein A [Limnochordia bacterium]